MAEPVLAFQFPEMDVRLQIKKKNKIKSTNESAYLVLNDWLKRSTKT